MRKTARRSMKIPTVAAMARENEKLRQAGRVLTVTLEGSIDENRRIRRKLREVKAAVRELSRHVQARV